ncbi:hypothetical protein [Bacillus sp. FJAT-45350]|uniref:hypothetical protein n=1 Tax=Bacillus sp. FJAT-45350 TaxID=2011014 RepID=UPI000BB98B91|nr:hypothetical protein [Bacillus sp. FJAT-45350]
MTIVKEKLVLIGFAMAALTVLIFSFEYSSSYPFLMAVIIIFTLSLMCFFTFMNNVSRAWFVRGFITNVVLITLLPIIEGMELILISVILLAVLAFTQFAYIMLQKKR